MRDELSIWIWTLAAALIVGALTGMTLARLDGGLHVPIVGAENPACAE